MYSNFFAWYVNYFVWYLNLLGWYDSFFTGMWIYLNWNSLFII